ELVVAALLGHHGRGGGPAHQMGVEGPLGRLGANVHPLDPMSGPHQVCREQRYRRDDPDHPPHAGHRSAPGEGQVSSPDRGSSHSSSMTRPSVASIAVAYTSRTRRATFGQSKAATVERAAVARAARRSGSSSSSPRSVASAAESPTGNRAPALPPSST